MQYGPPEHQQHFDHQQQYNEQSQYHGQQQQPYYDHHHSQQQYGQQQHQQYGQQQQQQYGQQQQQQYGQQQQQYGQQQQQYGQQQPGDQEVIAHICERLQEPQVRIPRAVVEHLGSATALELLAYTEQVQASGGMYVPETGKPRTHGGVFLQLLKEANHLPWEAQQAALHRIKVEGKNVKAWEKASVPGWS